MKGDALYRVIGGIVLFAFAVIVPAVKYAGAADTGAAVRADPLRVGGRLAIAVLGVLVSADGMKTIKQIRLMTGLIETAVREKNHGVTAEIAAAAQVHEVDVRERIEEMIHAGRIGTGTRITHIGGEKVVT